jgi:hypothetical protein
MNSTLDFVTTISRYPKIVVIVSSWLCTNKFREIEKTFGRNLIVFCGGTPGLW